MHFSLGSEYLYPFGGGGVHMEWVELVPDLDGFQDAIFK